MAMIILGELVCAFRRMIRLNSALIHFGGRFAQGHLSNQNQNEPFVQPREKLYSPIG